MRCTFEAAKVQRELEHYSVEHIMKKVCISFKARICTTVLFFTIGSLLAQVSSNKYDFMLRKLLERNVPEISVPQLAQITAPITLLDAREPKETKISGIAGAIPVGYDHFDAKSLENVDKSAPIVVYCSVGYRSEKITQRLIALGYTDVRNLYGGIFEWVNQGNQIVDQQGKKTEQVHAYSRTWGVWLRKGKKVY
jgi:rhodanese-related sulfurtransferase